MVIAPAHSKPTTSNRVLLVVSGNGADEGKTRPGFEMDELTQAYAVFTHNGLSVDIASPAGGAVVADRFDRRKPYNERFLSDAAAAAKLTDTRSLASLSDVSYNDRFVDLTAYRVLNPPASIPERAAPPNGNALEPLHCRSLRP